MSHYNIFVPKQAVGANLIYFDVFNPSGSQHNLIIKKCQPVVSGAVAVTGVVGVDLHLKRTTAVGTGGTAATSDGSSLTAMTITQLNSNQTVATGSINGRLTPTGGATAGAVISWVSVFTEETNSATYNFVPDLARGLYPDLPGVLIVPGQGFSVVQGAVASVGNIGFNVVVEMQRRP